MRYLYGDSTAFPLNENFIVTLAAATDCAVALLKVDENLQRAQKTAEQASSAAMSEIADIDQLLQRVDKAFSQREHLSNATAKVVEQVAATAKAQFDRAKDGILGWRDGLIRKANQGCGPGDVMAPVHHFMVHCELPYTAWGLRWKASRGDEPVQAQVYAIMQRGLTSTLAVTIPPRHLWSEPVRVSQLEKKVGIKLQGKTFFGKDVIVDEALERYFVTRVTRTAERHMMILSKKAEPSEGLRFTLKEGDSKHPTVQRVDADENPLAQPALLDGVDVQLVKRLWRRVEETICDLVNHRSHLLAATLYGKRITEIESPATVAVAIIQSVAPLVRDIQRHSRTAGELQLKRDLGDGRREELFISQEEIIRKVQLLTPESQQLFDCFGLSQARAGDRQRAVEHMQLAQREILMAPPSHREILGAAGPLDIMPTPSQRGPALLGAAAPPEPPPMPHRPAELLPAMDLLEAAAHRHTRHSDDVPPSRPAIPYPAPSRPGIEVPPDQDAPQPTFGSWAPPARSDVAPASSHQHVSIPPAPNVPAIPPPTPPRRRANTGDTPAPASPARSVHLPPPSAPPGPRSSSPKRPPRGHLRAVNS
jgi:hypothetical protein